MENPFPEAPKSGGNRVDEAHGGRTGERHSHHSAKKLTKKTVQAGRGGARGAALSSVALDRNGPESASAIQTSLTLGTCSSDAGGGLVVGWRVRSGFRRSHRVRGGRCVGRQVDVRSVQRGKRHLHRHGEQACCSGKTAQLLRKRRKEDRFHDSMAR